MDINMSVKFRIGGEFFRQIREEKLYYADKTSFINEFMLNNPSAVTLITRPRRFGKTLMMDTLNEFFNINKKSKKIFNDLEISKNTDICTRWMNKYPTIFLSLKSIFGLSFQESIDSFQAYLSGYLLQNYSFLLNSPYVTPEDKKDIMQIRSKEANNIVISSFCTLLMRCLKMHYKKNIIILIDEYDVPLIKAYENGYYDEMVNFIRKFLGEALKSNDNLQFAILTGCLRISKESIFTGLNNFNSTFGVKNPRLMRVSRRSAPIAL